MVVQWWCSGGAVVGRVENMAMAQHMMLFHELVVPIEGEQSQLPVYLVHLMLLYTGKTIEQSKEPWATILL